MSDIVLSARGIGKKYLLRHQAQRGGYSTLRELISERIAGASRRLVGGRAREDARTEEFWALRNVDLDVRTGEVVGLIGRNGAGKSTLLKIISRITEPTEGSVVIGGRVASLLEVGTGFHSELTGRENIFLNGAILGMTRAEIRGKFDQIVAFAEVERFLDTPVKRYSSGMYVRLAFAIAAHLEPEVLIIDEVLAVGDVAFQRKCLGRMQEVAREGRTILFVSHNMGLVRALCRRAVLIESGAVTRDGDAGSTVADYLADLESDAAIDLSKRQKGKGRGRARLARLEMRGADRAVAGPLEPGQPMRFVFHATSILPGLQCSFTIYDAVGQPVTSFDSASQSVRDIVDGEASFVCEIDELLLQPGRYRINAALTCGGELEDHVEGAAVLEVVEGVAGERPIVSQPGYGSVFMHHRWVRPC
jgi:lipopolysaccharide transport system ATP-binding protein